MNVDSSIATFLKFAALSSGGTLTDGVEVSSESITDTEVNLTLAEYDNGVTTTSLGHVVTGGRLNPAVAELVGRDMGTTMEKAAIQAGEGGSNEFTVNSSGEASTTSSDIITDTYFDKAYNKLRRANIPKLSGGAYVAVMHPDVVYDLKSVTSAGDWYDVHKYTDPSEIIKGEIGTFKGFRVIESSNVTVNADAGNGNVDTYHSQFFGFNAFGYAESTSEPFHPTMIGETDKLNRFIHIGWYGIGVYGLIDSNAHWLVTSASTVGSNT